MQFSPRLWRLIQTDARAEELQKTGLAEGLCTLRQDCIEKVWAGVTTIGEVRANTNTCATSSGLGGLHAHFRPCSPR